MRETISSYNWFAIVTRSRSEKKVVHDLSTSGHECYLPLLKVKKQWSDRIVWTETPAINSYIFIHTEKSKLKEILTHPNIVRTLWWQGEPAIIPSSEIEIMRCVIDNNVNFTIEANKLKKGKQGIISSGPLKGVTGTISDIRDNKQLILQISHLGYSIVIDLLHTSFELIKPERAVFKKADNKLAQQLIRA